MLDQGVDGNGEEAGKKSEPSQKSTCDKKRVRHAADQRRHDGHAQSTQRNQSVLNFVTREVASDCAADSNAERGTRMEDGVLSGRQVKDVAAVDQDCLQKQSSQKPEIGIAKNGEEEGAISAY